MAIDLRVNDPPGIDITMPDGKVRRLTITGPLGMDFMHHARKVYGLEHVPMGAWGKRIQAGEIQENDRFVTDAVDALLANGFEDLRGGLSPSAYMGIFNEAFAIIFEEIVRAGADSKKATGSPQPSPES